MNNTILHRKQLTGKVPNFAYFLFKKTTQKIQDWWRRNQLYTGVLISP